MALSIQCPNPACGRTGSLADDRLGRPVRCPHCGTRFRAAAATIEARSIAATAGPGPGAAPDGDLPAQVGRFQVRGRLGSGAFGTVYRAHDPQLEREVALKVPHPGTLADATAVERFLREAKAAARLRHPHIIPVYAAGCDGGRYYLAAAFVDGPTLATASEGGFDCRRAAEVVRGLAEALAYAHGRGIVHRDVKPANVLLDPHGKPHLLDFGLAHRRDEAEKLTRGGAVLGTPAYMAPEQAEGKSGEPLPASDQYSLGAVLYDLLCGRPPFTGPTHLVLYNVVHIDPPPPRTVNPQVPPDLEKVCLKALAKRPQDRYPGCQDLADDLRRWLEGEPVRARRRGVVERVARWCRREPALAGTVAVVGLCLLLAAGLGSWYAARLAADTANERAARQRAEQAQQAAAAARTQAEQAQQVAADARRAEDALQRQIEQELARAEKARQAEAEQRQKEEKLAHDAQAALDDLGRARQGTAAALQRQEQLRRQAEEAFKSAGVVAYQFNWTGALAFSPDGQRLAGWDSGKKIEVVDALTGKILGTGLLSHDWERFSAADSYFRMTFAPDGNRVIVAYQPPHGTGDPLVEIADLTRSGATPTVHPLGRGKGSVQWHPLAFSPDGRWLALAGADKEKAELKLWDLNGGAVKHTFVTVLPLRLVLFQELPPRLVAFSGDGKRVALVAGEGSGTAGRPPGRNGKGVAGGAGDNDSVIITVWEVDSEKQLSEVRRPNSPRLVRLSPDGRRLALADEGVVRVLDVNTGGERWWFPGPAEPVVLAFSPDGQSLVAAGLSEAAAWNLATWQRTGTARLRGAGKVSEVVLSPDGRYVVTASSGADDPAGVLRVWDLVRGQSVPLPEHAKQVWALTFSPDGKRLATATSGGQYADTSIHVWDMTRDLPGR
jgi:WD40 repeat protein